MELALSAQIVYLLSTRETLLSGRRELDVEQLFLGLLKAAGFQRETIADIIREAGCQENAAGDVQSDFSQLGKVYEAAGIDPEKTARELQSEMGLGVTLDPTMVIHRTGACKRIFYTAEQKAEWLSLAVVTPLLLLWAILKEGNNLPVLFLRERGCNVLKFMKHCEVQADRGKVEDLSPGMAFPRGSMFEGERTASGGGTPLLDRLGRDLTALAASGKLPSVIGMEDEMRQVLRALIRQDKNGVLLLGEPGVGKTAVAEGLAQLLAAGRLPDPLKSLSNRRIIELSTTNLVANTMCRGEFEQRMKDLIRECEENRERIILFIDEIHNLIGAGRASGSPAGASDMLKPALARGSLCLIGATTPAEYGMHIEKDPAIDRRFARVYVNEPSSEKTRRIVEGLRPTIEERYELELPDNVLELVIDMAGQYIPGKKFPDKALDLIHRACARKLVSSNIDLFNGEQVQRGRAAKKKRAKLDRHDVAKIVAEMCRLPVERILHTPGARMAELKRVLGARIFGQDEALRRVCMTLQRSFLGLKARQRPDGVFLFLGPTGTGKTELAKAIAKALHGADSSHFIQFDMSEYESPAQVTRLIGAPPGYVGYEQEGQLTGAVRKMPYSVVLFDEIEKAHPDVFKIFLQVFDEGRLTDSHGRKADFSHTILVMTSNLRLANIEPIPGRGRQFGPTPEEIALSGIGRQSDIEERLRHELSRTFRPEFLNRIDEIVAFQPLSMDVMSRIADRMLSEYGERLLFDHKVRLIVDEPVLQWLARKGYSPQWGARELKRLIERTVIQSVTEYILKHTQTGKSYLICDLNDKDGIRVREVP
jgi:ATP-dependent Clp protease ATP-binding subunit ClpC